MRSNWNITIRAEGEHHSDEGADKSKDADVITRKFIADLRAAGHEVLICDFTPGSEDLSRSG